LNDVTSGGSTVFPRQRLAVRPVKGSVLFWINMKVDGSVEDMSNHAACPVIYGEKIGKNLVNDETMTGEEIP
jgi:prolyl 4-hydroxylase